MMIVCPVILLLQMLVFVVRTNTCSKRLDCVERFLLLVSGRCRWLLSNEARALLELEHIRGRRVLLQSIVCCLIVKTIFETRWGRRGAIHLLGWVVRCLGRVRIGYNDRRASEVRHCEVYWLRFLSANGSKGGRLGCVTSVTILLIINLS